MNRRSFLVPFLPGLFLALAAPPGVRAQTADVVVAVAANFAETARELAPRFRAGTGHSVRFVIGSTGKLATQILRGAPFDILLAADTVRPDMLEARGLTVPGARLTYATGRIVLFTADPARLPGDDVEALGRADFAHLAIANPALAPYGRAAREALQALGLWAGLQDRLVIGQNVAQALSMAATGNADFAIVARALVMSPRAPRGRWWSFPAELHAPIRQDAVLLRRAAGNPAARAFMAFLAAPETRAAIRAAGFDGAS